MLFIETVFIKVQTTYTLQMLLAISQAMMTAIQTLWFACMVFPYQMHLKQFAITIYLKR